MEREKVVDVVKEYPSNFYNVLKSRDAEFVERISEEFCGDTFSEKLFLWANGISYRECELEECEKECTFQSFNRGYKAFCSRGCKAASKRDRVECENCNQLFRPESGQDDRKFCSRECVQEVADMEEARNACEEKYGSTGFGVEEIENEIRSTMESRYGNPHFNNRAKERETKRERYGDPNFNNAKQIRETKRKRYGDPYYSNREKAARARRRKKFQRMKRVFDEFELLFSFDDYDGIDEYEKYPFRCRGCGEEFRDHVYAGSLPRCPNCWDGWNKSGCSEAEKELREFVESVVGPDEVVANDRTVLDGRELDIFVPDRDLAIEFDGLFWHGEASGGKGRDYHLNKTRDCEAQGIQLVHVFGSEWALGQDVVKGRLRHLLGESERDPAHARECEVREVEDPSAFFAHNHLQGPSPNASEALGLFAGSELVSCMSFGARGAYQGTDTREWEVKRFAGACPVPGGASRLFTAFERRFDPWRVISFADRRWSSRVRSEPVYEALGFEFRGATDPGYWYFKPGEDHRLRHRFGFRKGVLEDRLDGFDLELTEWENMQRAGWDRVWDCGHLRYVYEGAK